MSITLDFELTQGLACAWAKTFLSFQACPLKAGPLLRLYRRPYLGLSTKPFRRSYERTRVKMLAKIKTECK